jgi:hypothetical protein
VDAEHEDLDRRQSFQFKPPWCNKLVVEVDGDWFVKFGCKTLNADIVVLLQCNLGLGAPAPVS